jgi:hypothetical protein
MHGVAPHMCGQAASHTVRRGSRGSLPRHSLNQSRQSQPTLGVLPAKKRAQRHRTASNMGVVAQLRVVHCSRAVWRATIEYSPLLNLRRFT